MKRSDITKQWLILTLLALSLLLCAACGQEDPVSQDGEGDGPLVIEPGVDEPPPEDPGQQEEEPDPEPFPDYGEDTTVEQLAAALGQVDSFYFEQTVPYVDGEAFMQVWYLNGVMKVSTSVDGYSVSDTYYDYNALTQLNYSPGSSGRAVLSNFDPYNADSPVNPKMTDYFQCAFIGFEEVNRQTCMVLDEALGSRLWVSTKYGFPLKVRYMDSLGGEYEVEYRNISYNDVNMGDVTIPDNIEIVDYTGN